MSNIEKARIQGPNALYFLRSGGYTDQIDNQTFLTIWNKTQQLDEMYELTSYGEYSVLIDGHEYGEDEHGLFDVEFFVLVSTLQPDTEGLVHQLVIRYGPYTPNRDINNVPLEKSYAQTYPFNLTSTEDGMKTISEFLGQESIDPTLLSDEDFSINYPFLTLINGGPYGADLDGPSRYEGNNGISAILNLCTGKVMVAATNNFGPYGGGFRLYPDGQPACEWLHITSFGFHIGDATTGSMCIQGYKYPGWNFLEITEVWINNTEQTFTDPTLPLVIATTTSEFVLNITTCVTPDDSYEIKLNSSKGPIKLVWVAWNGDWKISFVYNVHVSPAVRLSDLTVNFCSVDNVRKIDVEIGNRGCFETELAGLYVGTSQAEMESQTITRIAIPSGGLRNVTVDYDWSYDVTYYFRAVCSTGESVEGSFRAPDEPAVVRIDPRNVTVGEDDVFNVSVLIEIPREHPIVGVQFELSWDSTVLRAVNMTEIMFHEVAPPNEWDNIWTLQRTINNTAGFVKYSVTWQDQRRAIDGGYASIWGNHMLATITLEAIGIGSTTLCVPVLKAATSLAQPVSHIDCEGFVEVRALADSAVEIPELPFGMLATMSGMFIVLAVYWKRVRRKH